MTLEIDLVVVEALLKGDIKSSYDFAAERSLDHQAVVGKLKSLASEDVGAVALSAPLKKDVNALTPMGQHFSVHGFPEVNILALLAEPLTKEEVQEKYPANGASQKEVADYVKEGLQKVQKARLVTTDKATKKMSLTPEAAEYKSESASDLKKLESSDAKEVADAVKKLTKKIVASKQVIYFGITKGPSFPDAEGIAARAWRVKKAADFSQQQLREMWETGKLLPMKKPNIEAMGAAPQRGNLHPLMKLRQQYREIFLELGFQEMDTARFVDSSFWNFDTLFVPQQHPARDAQDTFFIKDPPSTTDHPESYIADTAKVHGEGAYGSTGYKYKWSREETEKNVLRTHTTSISSYTLHQIGQEYQRTGKLQTGAYFSIDRVFRNETMDKTHLCEFHQMEGFVLDYDLSLSNMMALLKSFFERVGVDNLMFKPAFNPYTEPSMEIHTNQKGKIMEVGNSGMFRPEMLRPMGLPEGVKAIAWGLGLERVAMRHYRLPSVHDLFGHKVSMPFVKDATAPRV